MNSLIEDLAQGNGD